MVHHIQVEETKTHPNANIGLQVGVQLEHGLVRLECIPILFPTIVHECLSQQCGDVCGFTLDTDSNVVAVYESVEWLVVGLDESEGRVGR